jgi:ABC-type microcin C transport system permease subunit YejE
MLSWMIAGGVLAGGFLVAYGTMTERVSGHSLLYTAGGLYLFGSLIGAILGGAGGMFGRPIEMAARKALRDQLVALLYALPALFLAFVLTGWIAMTVVAISHGHPLPLIGVSIAYLFGFLVVGVALRFGWFGARRAWRRFSQEAGRARRLRLMWVDEEEQMEEEEPRDDG